MEWRYVRLIADDHGWALRPGLDGYDAVLGRLNEPHRRNEDAALSDVLDALGSAGWELVHIERSPAGRHEAAYYFKRQIGGRLSPTSWQES